MNKTEQQRLAATLHKMLGQIHVLAAEASILTTVLDGLATLNNELVEEMNGQEAETGSGSSER